MTAFEMVRYITHIPELMGGVFALVLLAIYKPTRPFVIGGILIGLLFL